MLFSMYLIFKVYGIELVEIDKKKETPKSKEQNLELAKKMPEPVVSSPKLDSPHVTKP